MDAPDRGALMLVRFIAVSLMGVSVVELALYWVISSSHHTPMETFPCVLKSIPAVLGIVILIKARAVAEWISNKLDE
ncbi:MAG: hypothetical protein PHY43_07250 [Verrucomicrobiales bacterium]|nr:hypothetical protein [Verrucomicrobiales bacterium]